MSFWNRLFSRAKPDEASNSARIGPAVSTDWNLADCGFCGRHQLERDAPGAYAYPVWKCSCGAVGSGAWLPDLDEVGDQLLEMLGINARVSEPCVPTEHPAISMQRYDVNTVEHNLGEILQRHGYEFCVTPRKNASERLFWARRINEKT